ncbi:hypothetical protein [Leifsonia sp. Leaf264]|uniref:hypothetical protein n=1 Tax=Leifsonia sp. Leaf264 TaxID=1736314 RepID=UPI0006F69A4D|nr:hypothetical protein [Leifsonia sp. Leaf264]KQO98782.1 hypothetical protein ASF30_12020 [Leifsonia sp. Leaf264]
MTETQSTELEPSGVDPSSSAEALRTFHQRVAVAGLIFLIAAIALEAAFLNSGSGLMWLVGWIAAPICGVAAINCLFWLLCRRLFIGNESWMLLPVVVLALASFGGVTWLAFAQINLFFSIHF